MSNINTLPSSQLWTHKTVITQDVTASLTPFNASVFYQDFMLFGMPANHLIVGVKIVTLVSFVAGANISTHVYLGTPVSLPASPQPGAVDTSNFFGQANLSPLLNSPSNPDSTYNYGSFRWFMVAAPGSVVNRTNRSNSKCLPVSFGAQDIVARFFVQNSDVNAAVPTINQIGSGSVEITVQYMAI
jgi:hypothetical protein